MDIASAKERLETALREPQPASAVALLAEAFKKEGMTQAEMYRLYDEYRAKHQDDADETMYDAILDTMDYIVGWCTPSSQLYDTDLPHNAEQ